MQRHEIMSLEKQFLRSTGNITLGKDSLHMKAIACVWVAGPEFIDAVNDVYAFPVGTNDGSGVDAAGAKYMQFFRNTLAMQEDAYIEGKIHW